MSDPVLHTTIISLLIAIIIFSFILSIIKYHKWYVRLQRERIHAEITIQENERKRIANDLTNSLGPLLSSVKGNIRDIAVTHEADRNIVEHADRRIDEVMKSLQEISDNLLPHTLERKGLVDALREFTHQIDRQHGLQVQLHVINDAALPKDKEIHAFRMVQEIVQNALKHAGAKNLQIGLAAEEGHLLILTKDDGRGFDVMKARLESPGLGIKSLESRKELLKAQLIIESTPEKGTNHFIKIPVNA